MNLKLNLILFFIFLSLISCSRILFTESIYNRLENERLNLKKVQFYNNTCIRLERVLTSKDADIESGSVKLIDGKFVEIINIPFWTPGIVEHHNKYVIYISFEKGYYLKFHLSTNDKYYLMNIDDKIKGSTAIKSTVIKHDYYSRGYEVETYDYPPFYVNYGKYKYLVAVGSDCQLMIKNSQINKIQTTSRTVKGRKLE
jgi:hypothetical protein